MRYNQNNKIYKKNYYEKYGWNSNTYYYNNYGNYQNSYQNNSFHNSYKKNWHDPYLKYNNNRFRSDNANYKGKSNKINSNFNNVEEFEIQETYVNSKKTEKSKGEISIFPSKNFFNSSILALLSQSNEECEIISENPLFEDIQTKLNNITEYKQEDLIKDLNALINKNAFIQKFNEHSFINQDSFQIFEDLQADKIFLNLNLTNYINIINVVSYFGNKNQKQMASILNKLGINFSWVTNRINKELVDIVLLTPKSSILYNYISTHGKFGIKNKEYKEKVKEFINYNMKARFDYGYCYEDLTISHLTDLIGEENFEARPNVM